MRVAFVLEDFLADFFVVDAFVATLFAGCFAVVDFFALVDFVAGADFFTSAGCFDGVAETTLGVAVISLGAVLSLGVVAPGIDGAPELAAGSLAVSALAFGGTTGAGGASTCEATTGALPAALFGASLAASWTPIAAPPTTVAATAAAAIHWRRLREARMTGCIAVPAGVSTTGAVSATSPATNMLMSWVSCERAVVGSVALITNDRGERSACKSSG